MIEDEILARFNSQFDRLLSVVAIANLRVTSEPADELFLDNQNVFIKSFLVSACSVLEAFIQELAFSYLQEVAEKVRRANIPYNAVAWMYRPDDKKYLKFESFEIDKKAKDISDIISPNYGKTLNAFRRVGVELDHAALGIFKDEVSSIVDKRNKIVHENDDASDLSFVDITTTIHTFKAYAACLYKCVAEDRHRQLV